MHSSLFIFKTTYLKRRSVSIILILLIVINLFSTTIITGCFKYIYISTEEAQKNHINWWINNFCYSKTDVNKCITWIQDEFLVMSFNYEESNLLTTPVYGVKDVIPISVPMEIIKSAVIDHCNINQDYNHFEQIAKGLKVGISMYGNVNADFNAYGKPRSIFMEYRRNHKHLVVINKLYGKSDSEPPTHNTIAIDISDYVE